MLESLHIRNLALVEGADIEFAPGLNVVTGETGAGKSLILGAVQLLLGDRAGPSVIRRGAAQCELSAVVRLPDAYGGLSARLGAVLEAAGAPPCEDGQLLLRRVVSPSGSRVFVNAAPVTLSVLKEIGEHLVDIHGPHDHQSLLQPRCQLELLDTFAGLGAAVAACTAAHARLSDAQARLEALRAEHAAAEDLERWRHLAAEIDGAAVQPGEEADLEGRYRVAEHASRLQELAGQAHQGLSEADGSVADLSGRVLVLLREVAELDTARGAALAARLEEIAAGVQELGVEVADYAQGLEFDGADLARMRERRGLLQGLRRKYRCGTLEELLAAAAQAHERLAAEEHKAERLAELDTERQRLAAEYETHCRALSAARRQAAGRLASAVSEKLRNLAFARSTFEVAVAAGEPGPHGADRVEFGFAPNLGEDVLPLRRIASSGEMARVMLAVKTVLSAADAVPILIFDEVDANIGGLVAVQVAEELAAVAGRHQVLCVTHLAQIAAVAGRHFEVSKQAEDERTCTAIRRLDEEARVAEISRMLGSGADSRVALAHARELLARAAGCADNPGPEPRSRARKQAG